MKSMFTTLQRKKQKSKNLESNKKNSIRSKLKKQRESKSFQFLKEIELQQKLKVQ